jgi:hypothetical protein
MITLCQVVLDITLRGFVLDISRQSFSRYVNCKLQLLMSTALLTNAYIIPYTCAVSTSIRVHRKGNEHSTHKTRGISATIAAVNALGLTNRIRTVPACESTALLGAKLRRAISLKLAHGWAHPRNADYQQE